MLAKPPTTCGRLKACKMIRNVNRRLPLMAQASLHLRSLSLSWRPHPSCYGCSSSPQTASFSASARRCESRSIKYQEKMRVAQEAWDLRAKRIQSGTEMGLWDLLESRGFIKDIAGYVAPRRHARAQKKGIQMAARADYLSAPTAVRGIRSASS